jgi:hypothetical protein
MEILGYIVGRNLALIAVNVKHIATIGSDKFVIANAKKAYLIRDNILLTMRGNPYKTTYIKKYLLKLSELNSITSFDSIREDLDDVFNTAQSTMSASIENIKKVIEELKRDDGHVDTRVVEKYLGSQEEIELLRDITSSTSNNHNSFTIVSLFGHEEPEGIKVAHLVAIGSQISDVHKTDLPKDQVFLQFLNDTTTDNTPLQNELVKQLTPFLPTGWYEDQIQVNALLEQAKNILTTGINRLSLPNEQPNIVFYELSERTGFKFTEPEIKLVDVEYNYNKS